MNTAANLSPAYLAAIAANDAAQAAYAAVVAQYRAGTIGDAEYLKARAALKVANDAFDAAFSAEAAK